MASQRTISRAMRIWGQVTKALYPFSEQGGVAFDGKGRIVRYPDRDGVRDAKGNIVSTKNMRETFLSATLSELPTEIVRRFVWPRPGELAPSNPYQDEPEPTDAEFVKFRRLLLGTARKKLLDTQGRNIKNLPRLPGPGRLGVKDKERTEIVKKFEQLKSSEEVATASAAVEVLSQRYHLSTRQIWRILKRAR